MDDDKEKKQMNIVMVMTTLKMVSRVVSALLELSRMSWKEKIVYWSLRPSLSSSDYIESLRCLMWLRL